MKTTTVEDFVLNELARLRADLEANQERLRANEAKLEASQERLRANEAKLEANQQRLKATQQRLKATWAVCFAVLLGGLGLAASPTAQAQFGITLASLNTRLTAVETKTTPLSYNGTTKLLTVTGANVMIVDGTGGTLSNSRLGNLQVGYNELRSGGNIRTGSHNLILGDLQNYSSSGGLVAGASNEISGRYASITGGATNTASGEFASVTGGDFNTASGRSSCVSGGRYNSASFSYSSISGGESNEASGLCSSITGGTFNTASAVWASVSGGANNTANGIGASVTCGVANLASGIASSILGGNGVTLNSENSTYPPAP
jgi:hypothetical protein